MHIEQSSFELLLPARIFGLTARYTVAPRYSKLICYAPGFCVHLYYGLGFYHTLHTGRGAVGGSDCAAGQPGAAEDFDVLRHFQGPGGDTWKQKDVIEEQNSTILEQDSTIQEQNSTIREQMHEIESLGAELKESRAMARMLLERGQDGQGRLTAFTERLASCRRAALRNPVESISNE